MDFASILQAEVNRKRKIIEDKKVLHSEKKFFKRGDLVAKEREEYEKRHNLKREENRIKLKDLPKDVLDLETLGPHQDKLPMTLSRQEVIRRLRERKEPIRLFGESDYEAFQRLRKLEVMAPEINKGFRNDFKAAMDELDKEDVGKYLEQTTGEGRSSDQSKLDIKDDGTTLEELLDMRKKLHKGDAEHDGKVILKTITFLIHCWAKELGSIPEEKKKSIQVRTQSAILRQTTTYLAPLLSQLKKENVASDIFEFLTGIIGNVLDKDYVKASDIYLQMAIGNAPWPIGVTMVGIHARTGREKIFSQQIAHVLNDETQRKYIQGLKRLMTVAQRQFPTDPSKSVEYNAIKPL